MTDTAVRMPPGHYVSTSCTTGVIRVRLVPFVPVVTPPRTTVVGRAPTKPHAPVNQRDAPANAAGIAWLRNNLRPLLDALEATLAENKRLQRERATTIASTRQQ